MMVRLTFSTMALIVPQKIEYPFTYISTIQKDNMYPHFVAGVEYKE